jgi:hypothetical protein
MFIDYHSENSRLFFQSNPVWLVLTIGFYSECSKRVQQSFTYFLGRYVAAPIKSLSSLIPAPRGHCADTGSPPRRYHGSGGEPQLSLSCPFLPGPPPRQVNHGGSGTQRTYHLTSSFLPPPPPFFSLVGSLSPTADGQKRTMLRLSLVQSCHELFE